MDCEQIILATQNGKDWVDYLAALLTPTIAIIGSFVALQQWKTNRARLKHELFDRRYEQFSVVSCFLGSIMSHGRALESEQQKFLSGTRGMRFTFDKEISEYIDETVWHLAMDLECLRAEIEGVPVGEERSTNVKKQSEIKKQLNKELRELEEKFSKYLQLRH